MVTTLAAVVLKAAVVILCWLEGIIVSWRDLLVH